MDQSKNQKSCDQTPNTEEDLDSLLDSALSDFDKPLPKVSVASSNPALQPSSNDQQPQSTEKESNNWSNEFKQFQDVMQTILKEDPNFQKEFQMLANPESSAASTSAGNEFTASLSEAIKGLTESAQSMPDPSPEDLAHLLNSFNLGDGSKSENPDQIPDFMPLMHNVMQSLLSKELLYPALKDIVDKYPDWLMEKRGSLDEVQFEKYKCQYELMKQVCEEFENDNDETDDGKAMTFEKILMLMQKMQDCGNPPKELVGDVNPDLPFDEQGNIKIPGMPEQCTVM